jgi:hypothetical protein
MKHSIITFAAVYALIAGATSCGGGSNGPVAGTASLPAGYQQIERLARPAIKEVFQAFKNHDGTNRTSPYQAPLSSQTLFAEIGSFTTGVAGRAPAYATTLQSILIPDEIAADLSQNTAAAAYLGVETGGATGNKFGGRALTDDVIDISLGAIFGKTLSTLGLVPDDGKSSPCLTTDNVGSGPVAAKVTTTFPYVGTPN